jgi:hypothetical protein
VAKGLEKTQYVKNLENYIELLTKHSQMLGELVSHIEKTDLFHCRKSVGKSGRLMVFVDEELYELVDKANDLIAGPTRAYVDQD